MSAWPQYVMLVFLFGTLFYNLIIDQAKPNGSDRIVSVTASFVAFGILFGLLWAGGFWSVL